MLHLAEKFNIQDLETSTESESIILKPMVFQLLEFNNWNIMLSVEKTPWKLV